MRCRGVRAFLRARRIEMRVTELGFAVEATNGVRSCNRRRVREKTKARALPADVHAGVEIVDLARIGRNEIVLQRSVVELDGDHGAARIVAGGQILAHQRQQVVEPRINIESRWILARGETAEESATDFVEAAAVERQQRGAAGAAL